MQVLNPEGAVRLAQMLVNQEDGPKIDVAAVAELFLQVYHCLCKTYADECWHMLTHAMLSMWLLSPSSFCWYITAYLRAFIAAYCLNRALIEP